jgi:SepF-like predicted cell division protein (DUF552 family)
MSKECSSKKDDSKGKKKVKKETSTKYVEQEQGMDKVYIHASEVESYATAWAMRPANIIPHSVLEGTIFLNG